MASKSIVALIPARGGSKRLPGKNIRELGGHPLIAYTISAARASGVFSRVIVSTDAEEIAAISRRYGAETPFLRPAAMAQDLSPDIEWIVHALNELDAAGERPDAFSILRPTSPFRLPGTIRRAAETFFGADAADSLRAVEKVSEHPGKMWVRRGRQIVPLMPFSHSSGTRWQSSAYQSLPEVFVQNASLEIAWSEGVLASGNIEGDVVIPFVTEGYEGFDVNSNQDWLLAELLLERGLAELPEIEQVND